MSVCQGCGTELPPQDYAGRERKWCSERCRKGQYAGTCVDCGARTSGHNGHANAPDRCVPCYTRHVHETRRWTPEAIVEAIRAWNEIHGKPPRAHPDWTNAGPDHPASCTVQHEMGSWDAAILAAGFDSQSRTRGLDREEIVRLYVEERLGCPTIADRLGVDAASIHWHVKRAGVGRSLGDANRLRFAREREAA